MLKPTNVNAEVGHKLYVEYDDGSAGEMDLSNLIGKGVFAALANPATSESVSVGPHGEIRWTDELELCPDAMYLQLTGKSPQGIFPSLKVSADA